MKVSLLFDARMNGLLEQDLMRNIQAFLLFTYMHWL